MQSLYPADTKLHPSKATKVIANTATIVQLLITANRSDYYSNMENIADVEGIWAYLAVAHVMLGNIGKRKQQKWRLRKQLESKLLVMAVTAY